MKNNTSDPNNILLSVDKDENGEIVGWEMDLTYDQMADILNKAIREAIKKGDTKTARAARMFLERMNAHSKTDSKNKPEKK